jgi:PadR family transcriptional regulator PadR
LNLNNWQTQLRKGLLEIVVLNLLQNGRSHGYDMARTLKQSNALTIREGNIYPVLARLQTNGLITSHSESSEDGPPRKYFKLTELGHKTLREMNDYWDRTIEVVQHIRKGTYR